MERTAVCPGSFDPATLGHVDIITRASTMFDRVIVLVMSNVRKLNKYSFTVEERMDFLRRSTQELSNIEVDAYSGLLAEYVKKTNAKAIVKGLRAVSDFEDEFQQALTNKLLAPDVETVFMTTRAENMFLSSSMVKEVCMFGGDISSFVPAEIHDDIIERLLIKDK